MRSVTQTIVIFLALVLSCCTASKKPDPEGYRVVSYEAETGKWIILRNGTFDGKYLRKRITAICDFYKWDDHETVKGTTACDLHVGQLMVPNPFPKERKDFLDIWEMSPERLVINQGDGPDRFSQQFVILKEEVLPDSQ